MTREVCGICWCPYGDDGRCACPVEEVSSKPVGRYYWESVADYQFMAVPSEGTIHYEVDDFPLYTHSHKQLSDEEIMKHFSEYWNHIGQIQIDEDFLLIAIRAIIKEITE